MHKNRMLSISLLCLMCTLLLSTPTLARADAPASALSLVPVGDEPVLSLSRQANFRMQDSRSGTLIQLFADRSLDIYALGMLEDADDPVLMHAGSVTDEEYLAVEQLLGNGGFLSLPEWIETDALDGETVTLTAVTAEGAHTVAAYSPNGTPFGDIVGGLQSLLGAHENTAGE